MGRLLSKVGGGRGRLLSMGRCLGSTVVGPEGVPDAREEEPPEDRVSCHQKQRAFLTYNLLV